MIHDLIIIGGGPAGAAAAVYASRKRLKTIIVTEEFGGQSRVSADIQNWIGTVSMSGEKLTDMLKSHIKAYADDVVEIIESERVESVSKANGHFAVKTESGKKYEAKTALIASGSTRRRLEVPGASKFEHKGLTYCASCDGPLFKDMDVAVIGGGNAGFETAAQLLAYAKSVTLLCRRDKCKADPITIEKVSQNPKMKILTNAETAEIIGDKLVTGLKYKDKKTEAEHKLSVSGIFVEIGLIPSTDFVKDLVKLDDYKRIAVDPRNQRTSVEGVWAAGDTTDGFYHQNNIAAGDAIKAVEDIYIYLHTR